MPFLTYIEGKEKNSRSFWYKPAAPMREMQKLVEIVATEKEAEKLACRS